MVQIVNTIVIIDYTTLFIFLVAFFISLRNYTKTVDKTNLWLIISISFAFLFIVMVSNALEWGNITAVLDPAEDFILILVTLIWIYLFFNFNKST